MAEMKVEFQIEEGEPLGITPDDQLVITRVQAGTVCDGKIQLGDKIVSVNGRKMIDKDQFYRVTRRAFPQCSMVVRRDVAESEKAVASLLPMEREKLFERRAGFGYSLAEIAWRAGGPKLGLGIKHHANRVYVSRLEKGSLAEGVVKVGDRLIDVNATPVSDKDVAKLLILRALEADGKASFVVERAESTAAKALVTEHLSAGGPAAQPPSIQMPSDVREIMDQERNRMKGAPAAEAPKPILKAPGAAGTGKKISVPDTPHKETNIRSDTDPNKRLRSVGK